MATSNLLGLVVSELHGLRTVCLLETVTSGWCTKTVQYLKRINYLRFCGPFDILQACVKRDLSTEPACPVPRTLNKQNAARVKPTSVSSIHITQG